MTVLCTQKGNLELEFIQQPAYTSMTNNGKMHKAEILVPRVVPAIEKSLISMVSKLTLVVR